MLAFPHVLVAVDFSPSTDPLLECLGELRTLGTERVTLVYVLEARYGVVPPMEHRALYEEMLAGAAVRLRAEGFAAESRIDLGEPAARIAAVARETGADLIVLGSRGHNLLRRVLIGSTAAALLRTAEIPILLERIEPGRGTTACATVCDEKLRRVLLATDGSEAARAAEEAGQALASGAQHAVFLTVLDAQQRGEAEARALLEQLAAPSGAAVRVERGKKTADVIRRVAAEEDATLIVVGKRGLGEDDDRLLGSTADGLAARSGRPVLMVPAETVLTLRP